MVRGVQRTAPSESPQQIVALLAGDPPDAAAVGVARRALNHAPVSEEWGEVVSALVRVPEAAPEVEHWLSAELEDPAIVAPLRAYLAAGGANGERWARRWLRANHERAAASAILEPLLRRHGADRALAALARARISAAPADADVVLRALLAGGPASVEADGRAWLKH